VYIHACIYRSLLNTKIEDTSANIQSNEFAHSTNLEHSSASILSNEFAHPTNLSQECPFVKDGEGGIEGGEANPEGGILGGAVVLMSAQVYTYTHTHTHTHTNAVHTYVYTYIH
jgi:hypothetical protein